MWSAVRVVLLVVVIMLAIMWLFEERLIFFPSRYPEGRWDLPQIARRQGVVIEDCYFQTSDGLKLHGWYCQGRTDDQTGQRDDGKSASLPGAVLLWFHGNAGNITDRYEQIPDLVGLPADVFIIDYRGYGRSEGRPSEAGLYLDAQAAWDYLTQQRGVGAERIVIFGKSVGGAPAIELATHVDAAGLIAESTFTSVRDMAAQLYPFLPRFMLRTKMDSLSRIGQVRCPKLFIHGPADEIVPYGLGRKLFDAASEPKAFLDVPGAGHNETHLVAGPAYTQRFRQFLAQCLASGVQPSAERANDPR